ncbi:hypothetical protein SMALA_5913 [Streptomyces malaysiensis subsp. malaysiensis]|nr:hypothetical protein SMALA_5913 [Streptomyces malaysiensis]
MLVRGGASRPVAAIAAPPTSTKAAA